ncbi:hypothetical protein BDZ97DRAFT_73925 [Flammula alnicola]|nr:hypothetical protein BDZ97DRAFT_73925 [Flammula alnicola]
MPCPIATRRSPSMIDPIHPPTLWTQTCIVYVTYQHPTPLPTYAHPSCSCLVCSPLTVKRYLTTSHSYLRVYFPLLLCFAFLLLLLLSHQISIAVVVVVINTKTAFVIPHVPSSLRARSITLRAGVLVPRPRRRGPLPTNQPPAITYDPVVFSTPLRCIPPPSPSPSLFRGTFFLVGRNGRLFVHCHSQSTRPLRLSSHHRHLPWLLFHRVLTLRHRHPPPANRLPPTSSASTRNRTLMQCNDPPTHPSTYVSVPPKCTSCTNLSSARALAPPTLAPSSFLQIPPSLLPTLPAFLFVRHAASSQTIHVSSIPQALAPNST